MDHCSQGARLSTVTECQENVICFGMLDNLPYTISSSFAPSQITSYPFSLVLQPNSSTLTCGDTLAEYGILFLDASKMLSVLLKEPSIALQLQGDRPRDMPVAELHERATIKRRPKTMPQPVLQVIIYGARRLFESIGTFTARCRYYLQQPHNCDRNVEYINPHCLSREKNCLIFTHDLKSSVWYHNPHETNLYLNCNPIDTFTDSSQCGMLAESETPPTLRTRLYKHQKQALTFMIRREEGWALGDDRQDIWRRSTDATGRIRYINIVTRCEQRNPPTAFLGGLLVDAPGLGKTLSMISLLAFSKHKLSAQGLADRSNNTTLLVVPKTLIQNWKDELKRHLLSDAISYCEYYGSGRAKMFDQLQSYDLIITTFSVVRMDWKAHSKAENATTLHAIQWHRIILDEAHIIREPKKSFALSVCALQAGRRWCVTGTPIQNRLLDLYSLFKFLKCAPFDDLRVYKAHISRDGRKLVDASSLDKLKTLVNCLLLRRPKSTVDLPLRNDTIRFLDFSPSEQHYYELVKASATQCINEASEKAHRKAFLNALHRVNELRLICNYGIQNKNRIRKQDDSDDNDSAWTAEAAQTLFDEMETAGIALCSNPHCAQDLSSRMSSETDMQKMEEPRLGEPAELFCSTCFEGPLSQSSRFYMICNHLPRCSSTKTHQDDPPIVSSIFDKAPAELPTKIEAVVKDLSELAEGTKSVVFSTWTKTFDLLQPVLINRSIRCVRLDGSLSTAGRDRVLRAFRDNPGIAVLLATITCGGIGLNLTAASRAYIIEPQWNPMSESQALDRIHRLGQLREVQTIRYLIRGTWEEDVLKLQKHKQRIADVTLSEGSGINGLANRRLDHLREIVTSTIANL